MMEELQNKNSPQYALNAFVYNRSNVPQSKLNQSAPYPADVKIAMKNNPDPDHLIPDKLQGFDGLEARAGEQKTQSEENEVALHQAQAYLNEVEKDITTVVESVLPSLLHTYRKLSCQLLETIVKLRAYAGNACISADERIIQAKLEDIESIASDPAKVRARLDALLEQVRSVASTTDPLSSDMSNGNSTMSPANIDVFANHLEQEQCALQNLVESIQKCEQMAELLRVRQ